MNLLNIIISLSSIVYAIDLDVHSYSSLCDAITTTSQAVLTYYDGFKPLGVVGVFEPPYYWWEAGEAWGGFINAWYFCQNDTWQSLIYDSLMHQRGSHKDYVPANQSTTEGNDDQVFWGIAAMEAAERNFPNPPDDEPDWLSLAETVADSMDSRWDTQNCGGGLRWQIFTWNNGYNYKNTVSNGGLFHLAARLARYTTNDNYLDIAEKVWDWLTDVGFVQSNGTILSVFDGASIDNNCQELIPYQWTYNYGLLISGCAYLHSHTGDQKWFDRVLSLLHTIKIMFFTNDIMYEQACEGVKTCDNDQKSFKSVFSRFLGQTAVLIPDLNESIRPLLEASAVAAAKTCNGTVPGTGRANACGVQWTSGSFDNNAGLGQELSAMEVFTSVLAINETTIGAFSVPFSKNTGGNSTGGVVLNTDRQVDHGFQKKKTIDSVWAGLLTAISFVFFIIVGILLI
ncbi:hypothetical protein DASC09_037810 [Saccharomycopsis crataegensis]|uniref:Mannan endo-1,6-alpha-mannosidase n=1 Tax=Saccharomycopsis crataegensis TaxID=43959 RepID=A0AAV5QPC3_9ASCO|nr:hypothetical protein DASC09_037810 [Saccharomycopsis crataegensis]